jgi:Domain of unknown function (DUF1844)
MEGDEPKGFQVRDRRRFTETGEARQDAEAQAERPESRPEDESPRAAEKHPPEFGAAAKEEQEPPEITLGAFLMSLSTQALMCLGEIPNPVTGKTEIELAAVRELIDIISMLQEKTRGNVDAGEVRLFETILYDLRMRFVEKASSK